MKWRNCRETWRSPFLRCRHSGKTWRQESQLIDHSIVLICRNHSLSWAREAHGYANNDISEPPTCFVVDGGTPYEVLRNEVEKIPRITRNYVRVTVERFDPLGPFDGELGKNDLLNESGF